MTEEIELLGITEYGRHGVYSEEKQNKQKFIIDLKIKMARKDRSDAVETTVDYAKLVDVVRNVVATTSFDLIETLAEAIATECMQNAFIDGISVVVNKPEAAKSLGISNVSVSHTRE